MAPTIVRRRKLCTVRRIVLGFLTFFAASPLLVMFFLRDQESGSLGLGAGSFIGALKNSNRRVDRRDRDTLLQANGQEAQIDPIVHQNNKLIVHYDIEVPVLKMGVLGNYESKEKRSGPDGPGENGQAVPILEEEAEETKIAYKNFGFNMVNSDKISLDRSVPDIRDPECKYWHYPTKLPTTSVVVVFHNEGWTTLMRTIHSVMNESPPDLLLEIVMVDDFSDKEHLKTQLDEYIKKPIFKNKVRLLRNSQREGLVRSRIVGAQAARAIVVTFLDAHCECMTNWLPPLLAEIAVNRTTVVCPTVDSIEADNFIYRPQGDGLCRGAFDWDFWYKRIPVQESMKRLGMKTLSEAYDAPVMAGGLFAIERAFFFELDAYDTGLRIWGGENMEISFKAWMCGGSLKFVPCSRVGHVYRHGVPYTYPDSGVKGVSVVHLNYMRVAEVWMDEYKEYFYTTRPELRGKDCGDLSRQIAFRKNHCSKSFDWFMKNVAPDSMEHYPPPPANQGYGEIKSASSNLCVDTLGNHDHGQRVGMFSCHGMGGNQRFRLDGFGKLMAYESCLYPQDDTVLLEKCKYMTSKATWQYNENKQQMSIPTRNMCLDHKSDSRELFLAECNPHKDSQHFLFVPPQD